ncbi:MULTISPECIES: hypothetical protein, partial [unclassified Shewanella]|uniref:hypothetical protein n=1 Tax=unclassified Shewanella TaxID=196818 RepID=UPI00354E2947
VLSGLRHFLQHISAISMGNIKPATSVVVPNFFEVNFICFLMLLISFEYSIRIEVSKKIA